MQCSLIMRAAVLGLALVPLIAWSDRYKVGDSFVGFAAPDQHGTAATFKAGDAKFILFDTPGESGESPQPQDPAWFSNHRALPVVNISELSFVKRKVARSRLAAKSFRLLVVDQKNVAEKFPRANGKFSMFVLDDTGNITAIKFAEPGKELQELVTGGKP